jgi:protein-L-isoaspartate(D-aspartate) O-methyltransferase
VPFVVTKRQQELDQEHATERAPYDAIAVAAAAPDVPSALYEQLAPGGRLVVPRGSRFGQELVLVVRTPEGAVERASIPCRFVPLVGDEGFPRA